MDKKDAYIILSLVVLSALVCIVFYQGPLLTSDDHSYILFAHQILNGTFNITESPYAYGTLFDYSVATSYYLTSSYIIMQVLAFIGLVVSSYILCRRYFTLKPSYISAIFIVLSPFVFLYATRVLPDMLLGLLVSCALCLIAYDRVELLAGVLLGLTLFIKFGGAAFISFIVIGYIITYRKIPRLMIIGILLVICLYIISLLFMPGLPSFISMIENYSHNQASITQGSLPINILAVGATSVIYYFSSSAFQYEFPLAGFFLIALLGLCLIVWKRTKEYYMFVIAFLLSYLWLFFGFEAITPVYTFITVSSRYFIWLVPEMAVMCAFALNWLMNKKEAIKIAVIVFILTNLPLYLYFKGIV